MHVIVALDDAHTRWGLQLVVQLVLGGKVDHST
jgi:hypothetical protein